MGEGDIGALMNRAIVVITLTPHDINLQNHLAGFTGNGAGIVWWRGLQIRELIGVCLDTAVDIAHERLLIPQRIECENVCITVGARQLWNRDENRVGSKECRQWPRMNYLGR